MGRIAVRWSRQVVGRIKTVRVSREAEGGDVCFSCAGVPPHPLPLTGRETGVAVGLKGLLMAAHGAGVENPRPLRTAEQQGRAAPPASPATTFAQEERQQAPQHSAKTAGQETPAGPTPAARLAPHRGTLLRAPLRLHLPRRPAGRQSGAEPSPGPRPSRMLAGHRSALHVPTRQHAPVSTCSWWHLPLPHRTAQHGVNG